ncbi:MAG: hypothetical protein H6738_12310 [Alphaproteobacteria bacterium]|nr:hypothetical protein [Alphaproteobacteria bacterium]
MIVALLVACSQQRVADRWLAHVVAGEDEAAFAAFDVGEPPAGGFDIVRFGKRSDRLGLRAASGVRWDDERRRGTGAHLEGSFDREGERVPLALDVVSGRVGNVTVGKQDLVPRSHYVIVPDPRPWLPLEVRDPAASRAREGLRVEGEVDAAGTMTVRARCLSEGAWVADAIQGPVDHRFSLAAGVPEGWPCQLELRFDDGTDRRRAVFCASPAVVAGPCELAPIPDPSGPPVTLSAVEARWSPGGISVDYRLRAEVPQPEHGGSESASLTTRLTCPGGKRPVVHTRPLDSDWMEPGVDRLLGSPMVVHAEGRPCGLALTYVRDDGYDRLELPLLAGCVSAEGVVSDEPCP